MSSTLSLSLSILAYKADQNFSLHSLSPTKLIHTRPKFYSLSYKSNLHGQNLSLSYKANSYKTFFLSPIKLIYKKPKSFSLSNKANSHKTKILSLSCGYKASYMRPKSKGGTHTFLFREHGFLSLYAMV